MHEARMEKYGDKLLDFDNKYSQAFAPIRLNCEDGPRVYVKGVKDSNAMWSTSKRQYKASDLATWDNTVSQMTCHTQSDFKIIAKYRESIKQGEAKFA